MMNSKRAMKRILSLMLALVLAMALIPANLLTAKAEEPEGVSEPEMTEPVSDDTPPAPNEPASQEYIPDDTGNSSSVSYEPVEYTAPAEQSGDYVPQAEAAAPAAETVAEVTSEPAVDATTDPVVTAAAEPADEPATEAAAGAAAEPAAEPAAEEQEKAAEAPSEEEMTEPAEAVTYTVTFDANGHGTAPAAVTAEPDAVISEPEALSEDGYTFTGWYKEAAADEWWDFAEDKVTEDITLYAGWIEDELAVTEEAAVTFTVSFDANGHGTAPEAVIADEGALITEPAALSEDGYTFTGWYKDAAAAEKWDFSADKILEDITLYAGWYEEEPAVMFGTAADRSANIYSIEYVDRSDWLDGYPPDGDYMTGNWPENSTAAAGTVVSLPPIIRGPYPVEKLFGEGYVTYTWEWLHVVPRGSGNSAADNILDASSGTFVMPESDVIVRGAWTYGDSIQVFPHATKGGSVSHDGRNASWAESSYITLTAIPDPDYYFVGWKHGDESNPSGPIISTQNPWRFQATQDVRHERYWAVFAKQVPHSIKIYNGTADKTSAKEGETITITATEPSGNKVFDTWWAEKPSTLQFADENSTQTTFVMPRADVEVWATYKDLYSIIVQESEGGTGTTNSSLVAVGEMVTLTATPNGGWRFDYWEVVSGDVELADSSSAETTLTLASNMEDVIVKPHFYHMDVVIVITPITVQESEGGTGTANPSFISGAGETVTLTATPRGGYVFDHWEVISGGIELDNPSSAETTFISNGNAVVVKPHFEKLEVIVILNPHTVTYKVVNGVWADGTTADKTEEVDYGRKPVQIPTGMKPSENYAGGAWDVDPDGVNITEATTFTYTFEAAIDPSDKQDIDLDVAAQDVVYGEKTVITVSASVDGEYTLQIAGGSEFHTTVTVVDGQGSFEAGALPADAYKATVFFAGNDDYNPASAETRFNVSKADVNLKVTVHDAVYPDEIVCIVSADMDGEYALTIAGIQTTITVTVKGGIGSYNAGTLDADTYQAAVEFAGDNNHYHGSDMTEFIVSPLGTNFTVKADPSEVTEGDSVTIIHTLPADATGTIKYYLGTSTDGKLLGELPVGESFELSNEKGNALPAGTHAITASYSGDIHFMPAVRNVLVVVNPVPAAKPVLTITAEEQTYTYNGQTQGEGNTTYDDPAEIAEKIRVEGLKEGDTLTGITLEGQGEGVGTYDLIPSNASINGASASEKYDVIYKAGTLTIIEVEYSFSGDTNWTKGSSAGMNFTINRNFEDDKTFSLFESIEVDGSVIAASNYSTAAGSLKVTMNASYLNTLSNGSHTVKINFRDGSAETVLTIKPKPSDNTAPAKPADPGKPRAAYVPNTADKGDPYPWTGLLFLSLISMAGLIVHRRKLD